MLSWGRQGAGPSVALLYHSATAAVRRWSRPVRLPIHDRCGKSGSSQIAQQRACPACRYRPLGSTQKNVITMIKRDFMLMFLAHLPECMTWIYVRAVLHRVRSRKSRMLLKYIISDDFHLHLRKLMSQRGLTYAAITAQIGLSRTGVFDICKRFAAERAKGLVSQPRGRKPNEQQLLDVAQEAAVRRDLPASAGRVAAAICLV